MNQSYPVPPPELLDQWCMENNWRDIAIQAAQWGADQELEACCEWLDTEKILTKDGGYIRKLRAARRPKPPSLKEQALAALMALEIDEPGYEGTYNTIRRALEALDD
jgi:hypothetical protein